jgi:phosphatidylinositol-3-phosphatase
VRGIACRLVAATLVGATALGGSAPAEPSRDVRTVRPAQRAPSARSHVVVLVMENKEQGRVIGSHSAPFLNRLARGGGVATQSFGVRHPSLPNYIALVSGSTQGITSDCTGCSANGPNLADQLEAAHRTWGAYLEGLPHPCALPAETGRYAKKHDPFAYDDRIAASPARCRRRVPLRRLAGDIRRDRLPDFVFITPDLCHDTHDCAVRTGDRFLARVVPRLLRGLGPHGFLVVTYDEGGSDRGCCGGSTGGHIATVLAGPDVRRGARMTRPIDHYGVLASIEDAFRLPRLGAASDPRHGSLAPLFRGGRVPRL